MTSEEQNRLTEHASHQIENLVDGTEPSANSVFHPVQSGDRMVKMRFLGSTITILLVLSPSSLGFQVHNRIQSVPISRFSPVRPLSAFPGILPGFARSHRKENEEMARSWLRWLAGGNPRGAEEVKMREAAELGGVPRSDRYSSR